VKPTGIPPYYDPKLVAEAILYTAEHPTRDFIVGDVGRVLDIMQRISPGLVDSILVLIGFPLQRTNEPKTADAPNNLYQPTPEYDRVDGDFNQFVIPSVTDWLDRNPLFKGIAVTGMAVGAIALAQWATHFMTGEAQL
jgi:hypothetical protein